MNIQKSTMLSMLHALAVIAYIVLVVFIINSVSDAMGENLNDFWGPVMFLILFVVSAAITGTLVFGRPIFLYLNDQKKEAIVFPIYTPTWLFVPMVTFFAIFIIVTNN